VQQVSDDEQRVRENLGALKGTAEEKQLVKRYTDQLTSAEDRIAALHREQADVEAALAQARSELQQLLGQLAIDVTLDD
jgi:hypothetical protein